MTELGSCVPDDKESWTPHNLPCQEWEVVSFPSSRRRRLFSPVVNRSNGHPPQWLGVFDFCSGRDRERNTTNWTPTHSSGSQGKRTEGQGHASHMDPSRVLDGTAPSDLRSVKRGRDLETQDGPCVKHPVRTLEGTSTTPFTRASDQLSWVDGSVQSPSLNYIFWPVLNRGRTNESVHK